CPAVTTRGADRRREICLRLAVARMADSVQNAHIIEKMRKSNCVEVLMAAKPMASVTATKIQPSMGTAKLLCERLISDHATVTARRNRSARLYFATDRVAM